VLAAVSASIMYLRTSDLAGTLTLGGFMTFTASLRSDGADVQLQAIGTQLTEAMAVWIARGTAAGEDGRR